MALTDQQLDALRGVGDVELDPLVASYASKHGKKGVEKLMGRLFATDRLPADDELVQEFDAQLTVAPIEEQDTVERGQELFALYGPEILLILGSYSLPVAFAAGYGVQAIARARRLKDDPLKRLCDTAQMVLNVMQVGQLSGDGVGLRSARKVRLIHALLRWYVQAQDQPWDPAWGVPINQEDQLGTLMTFSAVVLHGLRLMGAQIDPRDADAFMIVWRELAPLLGIEKSLVPRTEAEGEILANQIGNRQIRPTEQARELMAQLLEVVGKLLPTKGWAIGFSHFFLQDTDFGRRVVEAIQLPPPPKVTGLLIRARAFQKRLVLRMLNRVPGAITRRRFLSRRFAQQMILLKRPDQRSPFFVPDSLLLRWRLGKPKQAPEEKKSGKGDDQTGRSGPA